MHDLCLLHCDAHCFAPRSSFIWQRSSHYFWAGLRRVCRFTTTELNTNGSRSRQEVGNGNNKGGFAWAAGKEVTFRAHSLLFQDDWGVVVPKRGSSSFSVGFHERGLILPQGGNFVTVLGCVYQIFSPQRFGNTKSCHGFFSLSRGVFFSHFGARSICHHQLVKLRMNGKVTVTVDDIVSVGIEVGVKPRARVSPGARGRRFGKAGARRAKAQRCHRRWWIVKITHAATWSTVWRGTNSRRPTTSRNLTHQRYSWCRPTIAKCAPLQMRMSLL